MLVLTPHSTHDDATAHERRDIDWAWVRSRDGQSAESHGVASLAELPRDPDTVLLLPPQALSWHWVACPKVPASRLRAVLEGLLEDRLLDDIGQMHLALAPQARPGESFWVVACRSDRLQGHLDSLEAAGRPVSRIVPLVWPQATPQLLAGQWGGNQPLWVRADSHGVTSLPIAADGGNRPAGWPLLDDHEQALSLRADPATAALAETLLGRAPEVMPPHELALRAAQGPWNLAQFGFSRSAGAQRRQRLRETWRRLRHGPEWRPLRWGLVGLVVVQTAALNWQAWQERQRLAATQAAIRSVLTTTFPQTRVVLDAPVQMQRAVSELRQRSGQVSPNDLESLLHHLGRTQVQFTAIDYGPNEVTLRGFQVRDPQSPWRDELARAGWRTGNGPLPAVVVLQPTGR